MAIFGSDPQLGEFGDTSSSSNSFMSDAAASGFYGDFSTPAPSGGGAMPGTGASPDNPFGGGSLGSDFLGALGLSTGVSPYAPAAPAQGTALTLFGGCNTKGHHLNKSTYATTGKSVMGFYPNSGVVKKGTKCVRNRRRNAGNAKAVRRALGRLAMFDNLARRVEGEMARVARRHHRPARAAAPSRAARGHRAGCRCFACRR